MTWRRIQLLVTLFILIFVAGLTGPSKVPEGAADPVAGQIANFLQVIVLPPTLLLMFLHRRSMLAGLRACFWPLAVSLLLFLSTAWSIERHITFRRSLIFLFVTLFGVFIGSCLSRVEQIDLYGKLAVVTVVGCFITAVFFPDYGISADIHAGEWKGLFQHKNILSRQMDFCLALLIGGRPFRSRYVRWATMAGALVLLALSRSGTGLLGFLVVLAGWFMVKLVRIRNKKTLPLWLACLPMGVVALFTALTFRNSLFAVVGKDETLTGRTRIWAVAFSAMAKDPWLGHGYAVFWRQSMIGRALPPGLNATHSHDGFFDVILDIGLIGLGLVLIALFSYLLRTLRKLLDQRTPLSNFTVFSFLFILVFLGLNFTESNLLREHTFLWLPFVSIYTALGLQQRADRARALEADRSVQREEFALVS